jgi:hypothetical protein
LATGLRNATVFYLDSFCLFNGLGEGFAVLMSEPDSRASASLSATIYQHLEPLENKVAYANTRAKREDFITQKTSIIRQETSIIRGQRRLVGEFAQPPGS